MLEPTRKNSWQRLEGKIASEILVAPKTGSDPYGKWTEVHQRVITYLENCVAGNCWANHLALMAAVMSAERLCVQTIYDSLVYINCRFKSIFLALDIQNVNAWKAEVYIPMYLRKEIVPEDSDNTRTRFWIRYNTATKRVNRWLTKLSNTEQQKYQSFIFPVLHPKYVDGLVMIAELQQRQKLVRKAETDAIVQYFAELRAEAHFRYNKIVRLRQMWYEAIKSQEAANSSLPFSFSYQEGNELLHFRVWDRRSFVLAYQDKFSNPTVHKAQKRTYAFSDEHNTKFLEYLKSERQSDQAPPEGFWFEELLRQGVLGQGPRVIEDREIAVKQQAWFKSWGYEPDGDSERVAPFTTRISGLLTWPLTKGESAFMRKAQFKAEGVFIPVEPFYAAATFGLLAINLFTTTGMRINEAMQIRLSPDCFIRLELPPPPESSLKSPTFRYLFQLIPKGERTDTPHNYFIGEETKRLLVKAAQMLEEHYQLEVNQGETLPSVSFSNSNGRSHRFSQAPYLFQYNYKHLSDLAITACMRFLLHGMVFKTRNNKNVVIKAHLLRHAFATHAVQVEKIPIDIVGALLKQKNLDVTDYYSQPTESIIAQKNDYLLARLATHINVGASIIRSPKELQKQYEEAAKRVGTLTEVNGGFCTCHGFCPSQFACNGCPAKVPEPAKRHQVEHKKQWAQSMVEFATQEGLLPEVERVKQLIRDCEAELQEMTLIEQYRENENYEPTLKIESN